MKLAMASIPVIGVYVVVICYHLSSFVAQDWVKSGLRARAEGVEPGAQLIFMAVLIASVLAWFAALLFFCVNASYALRKSSWLKHWRVILAGVAVWCIVQPLVTSLCLPQAMSLFNVGSDDEAARFIGIFKYTRFPGFVLGLSIAFTLGLLLLSLWEGTTLSHVRLVRRRIIAGVGIFMLLVILGVGRIASAQQAVVFKPADATGSDGVSAMVDSGAKSCTERVGRILRIELVVYTVYYSMMALLACYGAMFAFNGQVERLFLRGDLQFDEPGGGVNAPGSEGFGGLQFGVRAWAAGLGGSVSPILVALIKVLL